ncbi:hypothetical protein V6N11_057112 [Hibiscus sabdariffa]|uniref:Terpene synthase N-terminal domain-containing protein n=2 Tax=Hibiscus sabdariffa TaxID=183260 RepID=A0ABR1Z820_9ROSI
MTKCSLTLRLLAQNIDASTRQQHEELKQEVRRRITVATDGELLYELRLIDAIRWLGVSYHFKREIEEALHNVYELECQDDQTLEATSLRFRLLRENGCTVPCGACFLKSLLQRMKVFIYM